MAFKGAFQAKLFYDPNTEILFLPDVCEIQTQGRCRADQLCKGHLKSLEYLLKLCHLPWLVAILCRQHSSLWMAMG